METFRYITTAYIVILLITPGFVDAYSRPTHQAITQETLQAYEAIYGNIFTSSEEQLIINGSNEEDDGTRPLNHFYDPIVGKGLTAFSWFNIRKVTKGDASPLWALDTRAQAAWSGGGIGSMDKLFSNPTDYSWERGVYEYVQNERTRGLATLGHTLHLLQDATVPAHVRNDDHLTVSGEGDVDPYESYTAKFKQNNIRDIKVHTVDVPSYDTPDIYIKKMAAFTNKNFLSKDTVFEVYNKPSKESINISKSFGYQDGRMVTHVVAEDGLLGTRYNYDLDSNILQQSYWETLSHEAVRHGVGLIDLFLHAAEEEAETSALRIKNKSSNELAYESGTRKLGFALVKIFYGSSMNEEVVQELNKEVYASRASQFRPPTVQNKAPAPSRRQVAPSDTGATIIRGTEDGTNEIITPAQQAAESVEPNYEQMSTALLAIEKLMVLLMQRFDDKYGKCAGIDLSLLKMSTCIKPFDPGGYAYGGGGAGTAEVVACVPAAENNFCNIVPPPCIGCAQMQF